MQHWNKTGVYSNCLCSEDNQGVLVVTNEFPNSHIELFNEYPY